MIENNYDDLITVNKNMKVVQSVYLNMEVLV